MTHPPPTPPPVDRRRRRNPQATRDRLVRAALDLFTTQGYHDTTTPQIARRAGVAEGTIYRHFESKEHLLNEIYRAGVRRFQRSVTEGPGAVPCEQRLAAIAEAWRQLAARDAALVRMVVGRRFAGLLDERSRQAAADLRHALGAVIASGKAAGSIRSGNAETWAEVWYQLVSLTLDRIAAGEWKPHDAAPDLVTRAAWDAIRASAAAGQDRAAE